MIAKQETFINEPPLNLLPELIRPLLGELNSGELTFEHASAVTSQYQKMLHPKGWTFHSLNDGFGEEWNISFTPPEKIRSYCFQRFNAIPKDPWRCYIVTINS